MWGERGLISHKFEGTGVGVLACALKGGPGAARKFTVLLSVSWACSWRLPDGPGWQLGGCTMDVSWACSCRLPDGPGWLLGPCTMGVQLAVARWARLAAGRVHNRHAAGGCPMGQAGSWVGALWACSWRVPDGPGWQLGCTMGMPWLSRRYRGCRTHMICRCDLFLTQKLWWWQVILLKLYIFKYISTVLYMRISKAKYVTWYFRRPPWR